MLPMSSAGESHSATRLTEAELSSLVITSTRETFSTMIMMELRDESPLTESVSHFHNSVSGMVGFAGVYTGSLSIHCPLSLARMITASMLGMECEEVDDDINDALGEVANMLGGASNIYSPLAEWMSSFPRLLSFQEKITRSNLSPTAIRLLFPFTMTTSVSWSVLP